jgi:hypothetical protein
LIPDKFYKKMPGLRQAIFRSRQSLENGKNSFLTVLISAKAGSGVSITVKPLFLFSSKNRTWRKQARQQQEEENHHT